MADLEQTERKRVSRKEAAELLVDIAYALVAGVPLELRIDDRRMRVPVSDHLLFERVSGSDGNCFELQLKLSWSTRPAKSATRADDSFA